MKRTKKKVCMYACSCTNAHCIYMYLNFALEESKASSVKKVCVCVCVCVRVRERERVQLFRISLEITYIYKEREEGD